ncbi:transcription termination factor MTERF6, chloroplastic/mitochondrial-like [Mercurialis annua]|uniref:transcription termination factor MTERF6, chloroplastic/mitochondrial-like n=1 Tax=Mercurialis annua TaxID=3986 RepID=UPI00215F40D5|nr:transcription termination factor MTERF6, chloroplastic/mitochondrial-like [Mercurialis annua]
MMNFNTRFLKLLSLVEFDPRVSLKRVIFSCQKYPRCISSNASEVQHSFAASYLINNLDLSPKSALSVSRNLRFKNSDKPDAVLAFFKKHGFSNAQIRKLICGIPAILASHPEKTILPKFQFFYSKGFSGPEIAKILCVCPCILHSSLERKLIPAFNVIKNLLHCERHVVHSIRRFPKILLSHLEFYVIPNIKKLQESGLPESSIVWLLKYHPESLITTSDRLAEIIKEVKGIGLNPSLINFVIAIHVRRSISLSTWEKKLDTYKKWGWSEEEILVAFGKHPLCMAASEKKITRMMDFYVNHMGWSSSAIANYPLLIALSLEKRVEPRCSVIQVLQSKGLIKLTSIVTPLLLSDKSFVLKFVTPHEKEAPELLRLYQEKLNIAKCEDEER